MKVYDFNQIKNILLVGNSGSGKTTLAESMLFEGGIIDRRGDVESKNTVSDNNTIEHENTNSVFSTILYTKFKDSKINFIDTPGMDDFVGGVISSLRIMDTAVVLMNAQNGVEVGTEIVGRHLKNYNKPMMFAVNHLDHDKTNFEQTVDQLKERFGSNVILAQYPVNQGIDFDTVIDVIKMKMLKFSDNGKTEILDIPANEKEKAEELQSELIEKAAENDESLMELFFENDTLTEDEMRKGIKAGLIQRGMFPVFCISAKSNMGVNRLMEFIDNVAPLPYEMPTPKNAEGNDVVCDKSGNTSLFVFKTSVESHIGEINFFKVMSGEVSEGMDLVNQNNYTKERLSQLYVVAGKNRTKVEKMVAGDVGATVKLKNTKSNQTLNISSADFTYDAIEFPNPKYRSAIKPLSEGDEEKLGEALGRMSQEDPTYQIEYSKELKQIIIHGQGEYHLNILKWHLDNIFKLETEFVAPKIPYRETITRVAQSDYRHKKQSGGAGQFGEVHMVIEPFTPGMSNPSKYKAKDKEITVNVRGLDEHDMPWGGKLVFVNCIVGGAIDARFFPAILKGLMEKMEEGPLTGSYARDIRVCVYDGKMHPVDSNEISFKLAGRNAFSVAFKEAGPKILEPIYLVEVLVPSERMGDVMSDLQGRRGVVQGMSSEEGYEKITAKIPLAEMNKYSTALSSLSQGRAMYSMKFSEYAQVPGDIQIDLIKAYEKEQEEQ